MPKSTPPPSLYKYLPSQRIDFFDLPCLRFTPVKELNDPFESQISMARDNDQLSSLSYSFIEIIQTSLVNLLGGIVDTGILSLSENHKNLLMWSHYTNNHKGFALELDSTNVFFEGIDKVNYSIDRLCFDEIADSKKHKASLLYRNVFHKSIDWSYEDEWRLFKPWVKKLHSVKPGIVGLVECPIEVIKNIYLGLHASSELLDKAKGFCNLHPEIGLYQAQLHQTRYSLNFIQILT